MKTAYDRYQVVLDKYRSGGYEKREKITDQFFTASADAIHNILELQERRRRIFDQAKANVREIQTTIDGFEESIARTFDRIKYVNSKLGAEMKQKFEESREALLKEIDRYK